MDCIEACRVANGLLIARLRNDPAVDDLIDALALDELRHVLAHLATTAGRALKETYGDEILPALLRMAGEMATMTDDDLPAEEPL